MSKTASLAFVRGIHRAQVNSPHKWPVTRKIFPFDDVIMMFPVRLLPGFILLTRHADDTFLIGLYITHPDYRGMGIGTSLFDACITAVKERGTVQLFTAKATMKTKYQTKGFLYNGMEIFVITGYAPTTCNANIDGNSSSFFHEKCINIRPYTGGDFAKITQYELKIGAVPRAAALKLHFNTCVSAVVAFSGGEVVGYATTQQHSGFFHIKPVYADNETIATALVKRVISIIGSGKPIVINSPLEKQHQFWKLFGISSVKHVALHMANKPIGFRNMDCVYSTCDLWYSTM